MTTYTTLFTFHALSDEGIRALSDEDLLARRVRFQEGLDMVCDQTTTMMNEDLRRKNQRRAEGTMAVADAGSVPELPPPPHREPLELVFQNARENPEVMARWLAVEVLMSDPEALDDEELVDRLCRLQDRIETATRKRYEQFA